MATKTNSQRLAELRKGGKKEEEKTSSSKTKTYSNSERLKGLRLKNTIGLDTLESDLKSLGKTVEKISTGWQTEETMKNTRSSVESMYDRLNAYQEYQKTYGGADLTELSNTYKSVLDGWDDLTYHYSKYKSADDYKKALEDADKAAKETEGMKTADLNVVQTEIDDLQKILDTANSKKPKTNLTSSTKRGMAAIEQTKKKVEEQKAYDDYLKSVGFSNIDDIEKALTEKKVYKNKAQRIQDGISLSSVADVKSENYDENFDDYSAKGTALGNEKNDDFWWKGGTQHKNQVAYLRNNPEALEQYFDTADENGAMVESILDSQLIPVAAKYMEEDEAKLYDYYVYLESEGLTEEGTAEKYLKSLEEDLKQRQGVDIAEERKSLLSKYSFGYTAGIDQFTQGILNNFNTDDYIPASGIQNASAQIRVDIDKEHGTIGQGAYDLITTTSNMAPSILASAISNVALPGSGAYVGGTLMGASARGNAYQEMLNQGYDKSQASTYATLVGVSEAGLQVAFGGISKLGGKLTGKTINAIANGVDNALGRFAIKYGLNMVAEGFEEAAQEVLNPFFENLALGYTKNDFSDIEWSEVAYSGVLGALSAGFLEGGSIAANTFGENANAKKVGANIRTNAQVQGMLDTASLTPQESDAYNLYTHYANKGVNAENISDLQLGRLHGMAQADAMSTLQSKKSTVEQQETAKKTLNDLFAYNQENIKTMGKKDIQERYGEYTEEIIAEGLESGKDTESYKLAIELQNKLNDGQEITTEEIAQLVDANDSVYKAEIKTDAETRLTELGETTEVATVAEIITKKSRGEILSTAETEILENSEYGNRVYNEINYEEVADHAKTMDKEDTNLFISLYNGKQDVEAYANSFNLVKSYAQNRFTDDYILEHKGVLSGKQASAIYAQYATDKDNAQEQIIVDLKLKHKNAPKIYGKLDDSVIEYGKAKTEGKVRWEDLNGSQQRLISIIGGFGVENGIDVELITDGLERGINGAFEIQGNKILLDVYAGMDKTKGAPYRFITYENLIMPTFSHELTHWMKEKAPELYRKYEKYVIDTLKMSTGMTEKEILARRLGKMQTTHPDAVYSDAEVRDEVVARASEDMLARTETMQKFVDTLPNAEKKTFIEKVKEILQGIKEWFEKYIATNKSVAPEAEDIRKIPARIDTMIKMYDEMLVASIAANQALKHEGVTGESIAERVGKVEKNTTNGDVQYAIREEYVSEINAWVKEGKPNGETFVLGSTGDVLQGLGAIESDIYMLGDKINDILSAHPEMTIEEIKKIPQILENPVLILKSQNVKRNKKTNTRLVIFGNIKAKDGKPILSVLDLRPQENNLVIDDMQKVTSAYTKDTNPVDFVRNSAVLYAEKNKTTKLLRTIGFQMPITLQQSGYIGNISYAGPVVNIQGEKFSNVFKENDLKNADRDSDGNTLTKEQIEFFKDSKVRDENGNLKVMYHGTENVGFTVFDTGYSDDGISLFFTDNLNVAKGYSGTYDTFIPDKKLTVEEMTKELGNSYYYVEENNGKYQIIHNKYGDLEVEHSADSYEDMMQYIRDEWTGVQESGNYKVYLNLTNPLVVDADGNNWDEIEYNGETTTTRDLSKYAKDNGYDGVVFNNLYDNAVYASGSERFIQSTVAVAFDSNQVKSVANTNPTTNPDIRFALRENVEETKDLIAVHNLSPDKLLKSLNLGGLPMPSIAILKAQYGHNQFGDISLVFNKNSIDPEQNKANKVYGGDAWTPVYPGIEHKVKEDMTSSIYRRARAVGHIAFFNPVYLYPDNIDDDVQRWGGENGLIEHHKNDYGMKNFYLAEISEPVKMVMGEKKSELSAQEIEEFDFITNELGKDVILKINTEGYSGRNWMQEFGEKYKSALEKYYRSRAKAEVTDEEIRDIIEQERPFRHTLNVQKIKNYLENGSIKTETFEDIAATREKIDSKINEEEYATWLKEMFGGIVEKSGIRNNVDPFTPSGNRRSFEATHYAETLENVVKAMKQQKETGNSILFSGLSIWGTAAKRYNSIEEVKADSNRLVEWNEQQFSEIKTNIGNRLTEMADSIKSTTESNQFIARDTAIECILETISTAKTRSGMLSQLKSYYGLNQALVNESLVQDIIDLVADVQAMPTDYFEAKPQRAVMFNEVAGVVMPSQESYEDDLTEIKTKLNEMGIPIAEYTYGFNDERIKALNSFEDVKFADRDYINAVENKDTDTLERLIEDAAEKAMPNSKVRDGNGKLLKVYHGRVSEFNVFDRSFSNIEGDFGKGYYFTSNEYDVDENYASEEGPDLKNKIARYAEQLEWQDEYADLSDEEREEIARQHFITSEPSVITAYLNMENPVYITPNEKGTFLDFNEEYDEENDEYGAPEGLLVDFIEALSNNAYDYSRFGNVDFSFLYEEAYDGGMYAADAVQKIKNRIIDEFADEEGNIAINEIIRLAFEEIGFDGIIDTSVYYKFRNMNGMDSSTTHYIVFNSEQIKEADLVTYDDNGEVIPLSERFDSSKEDIRYADRENPNIANYTETQYNNFGWVRYNDVLTSAEYNTLLSRYADYKHNKDIYPTTRFGEAVVFSFDYPDVLMYVKGTIRNPHIRKVVRITEDNTEILKTIREEILKYEYQQVPLPYQDVQSVFGEGILDIYRAQDCISFQGYKREREREFSKENNPLDRVEQDGRGSIGQGETVDKLKLADRDYVITDNRAAFTEKHINELYEDYSVSSTSDMMKDYAQEYVAYISPSDFLSLTSLNEAKLRSEAVDLDLEKLQAKDNRQLPYLEVDEETGKVYEHDGRHRLVAFENAGIEQVAIRIVPISQENKYHRKKIDINLQGQEFKWRNEQGKVVSAKAKGNVTITAYPLSPSNRPVIEQLFGTGKMLYSDRDNVSVYDKMGETDRLIKENQKLIEDVERLKERLKIERQVTHGNYLNLNQLGAVAGHLRNISNSNYSKTNLIKELEELYLYILHSEELSWDDMFSKAYDIASRMIDEAKPDIEVNDYAKRILKDIRSTRITINEGQKQNAIYKFGKNYRNSFMGKVTIVNSGTSLDRQWKTWSKDYPDFFDESVSDADQLVELYNIYDDLRDISEVVVEYDTEERTRWLAREIYNQFWNVSPVRTVADKYDKQIKLLNFEHRRTMQEFRDDYNARLKKQHTEDREKFKKLAKEIRERKDKEIAEIKKLSRERMDAYKENAERKTKIQSITQNALTLNTWFTKNSKDEHIHEAMKGPVITLLNAIDFSSKRLLDKNIPTQKDISLAKALSKVKDMMKDATMGKEGLIELYGHDMGEEVANLVEGAEDLVNSFGDNELVLSKMSLEQLKSLDKLVKLIKQTVTKMNKFHVVHHKQGIANLSDKGIEHLDKLGDAIEHSGIRGRLEKMLKWTNATPYYAFKRLGETGIKVFEALQDGWDKLAFNVRAVTDFTNDTYTSKEVREWSKETKTFTLDQPDGKKRTFEMPIAQIMALHCVSKQEDAIRHLLSGGMTLASFEKNGKVVKTKRNLVLTMGDIQTITDTLSNRQLEVANKLQEFMNTVCANWGNEVSMQRFAVMMFTTPNYFPIKVTPSSITKEDPQDVQDISLFRLLNMSFTKSRNEFANQSIEIGNIFDVFAQHSSDMAKYNALALPVLDAYRWYSYKGKTDKGIEYSTYSSLENALGGDSVSYFNRFLKDLNGSQNVSRDNFSTNFFRNAKIAAVANNLRVVFLQPTAYVRASAVIKDRYLTKAFLHKPKIAKAEKYCGMALWKSMGYYDVNISKGVADKIKHAETWRDKAIDWSMKGAEVADKLTFGYLWNACELEIRAERKDLKVGSEEFYNAIAKRLREVIYATQVVDSTMTRSHIMRSADKFDKVLTAFMSEPTLSYNMVADAFINRTLDKRANKKVSAESRKYMARVLIAYTTTNMLTALIASAFEMFRDDEDEELEASDFWIAYFKNLALDMSITGKLPYIKDLVSVVQGYSASRTDAQWMTHLFSAGKAWYKIISGDGEGQGVKAFKNTLRTFSDISGLAFFNVYRDLMAALNKLDILTAEELEELIDELFGY